MNYYLEMMLQLFIEKLNKLKDKGVTTISIESAINILANMQKINKGETISTDFNLDILNNDNK